MGREPQAQRGEGSVYEELGSKESICAVRLPGSQP